jgi:hypothetical protein
MRFYKKVLSAQASGLELSMSISRQWWAAALGILHSENKNIGCCGKSNNRFFLGGVASLEV